MVLVKLYFNVIFINIVFGILTSCYVLIHDK